MTTPPDPESIAVTLPNMTASEVRERLAAGAHAISEAAAARIIERASDGALMEIRSRCAKPSLASSAALARYHEQIEKVAPLEGEVTL